MVPSLFNIEKFHFFWNFLKTQRFRLNYCCFSFQKIWQFFTFFFKKLNFGLMVWTICVTPELFNIGGLEGIIWSPPSSNGSVIGPLLASGGRKNHIFSLHPVDGITTFIWQMKSKGWENIYTFRIEKLDIFHDFNV